MGTIQGKVIRKLSPTELVVNIGRSHGVDESSRFIVFALGDEVNDPDTGESLGSLEIVRGRAEAKHVQEKMSTIRSVEKRRVTMDRERPLPRDPIFSQIVPRTEIVTEEVEVTIPFEGVQDGDLVRVL